MKLFTTLLLAIFISSTLSAQIVIDPDIIMFEATGEDEIVVSVDVFNYTDEFTEIYWIFEKGENFPDEWGTTICDTRICYAENTYKSNANLPNLVDSNGKMFLKFTIATNDVEGSSFGIVHLFSDSKFENEIAVSNAPITSVNNEIVKNIVIYPNPASDYFQIKNDANVKSVEVASITGRTLLSANHIEGKMHSIVDLSKGVFFVILRDENGDKVKTMRLIK